MPLATVAGVEAGSSPNPTLRTIQRLVAAVGARLAVVDIDGSEPTGPGADGPRDRGHRRFPAHLDVRPVAWRGIRRVAGYGFLRDRHRRDYARRYRAGELREGLGFDIRRLGPADTAVLNAIRAGAGDLDPAGRPGQPALSRQPALSDAAALRYLRDPSVRHWVAQERHIIDVRLRGRVLGHLVAYVHRRHTAPPTLVVTEIGLVPGCRAGLPGIMLVAAMSDEAARLDVGEVVAMVDHRAASRLLRRLGFRPSRERPAVLTLPW